MFTSVDSDRKKILEHLPGKDVHNSPPKDNSFINEIKFAIARQFQKLLYRQYF